MPAIEFLNERQFTDFPFDGSTGNLPKDWFVDCQVLMGSNFFWGAGSNVAISFLVGLGPSTGLGLQLTVTTIDPLLGSTTTTFDFLIPTTAQDFDTFQSEAPGGVGICTLTVGRVSSMNFISGAPLAAGERLLPQNITTLWGHQLSSVSVANKYATQIDDEECGLEIVDTGFRVEEEGMTGAIVLKPGRFCRIDVVLSENEFNFRPNSNPLAGGVLPCDNEIRVLPETYELDLEPRCGDLLYTVNGIGAAENSNAFQIVGSRGVSIRATVDELGAVVPHSLDIIIQPLIVLPPDIPRLNCD